MTRGAYEALLLLSFGGPEGPDEVMPFLERVTQGRGVPRERLEEVSHHYLALGGVSPINAQNRALLTALREELARRRIDLPIEWGNRNSEPFVAPVLARLRADGHRRVLAIATSAYSSYSSCRQYREDLGVALEACGLDGPDGLVVHKLRPFWAHAGFLEPWVEAVDAALRTLAAEGVPPAATRLLFTTHSIPTAMAAASGPPGAFGEGGAYVAQHLDAIRAVVDGVRARGLEPPAASLVYQSRSGSPHVPWLEPDVNDALRAERAAGAEAVVLVPIGFVSDHVEVVWDLDHEAAETCDELGLRMLRVPTPGTHPALVRGLVDLVEARLGDDAGADETIAFCGTSCCVNPRGERPVVAGVG